MTDQEIIEAMLMKYTSLEFDVAGEDTARAIANGAKIEVPRAGESFNISLILGSLSDLTAIVANLIAVYAAIRALKAASSFNKEDLIKEVMHEIKARNLNFPKSVVGRQEELFEDVWILLEERAKDDLSGKNPTHTTSE